jgi:hypothetical protein
MGFEQIWLMGIWTVIALGLLTGAVYFLRSLRGRILPPTQRRDRGEALAELHLLQTEMKKKLEEGEEVDSSEEAPQGESERLPPSPAEVPGEAFDTSEVKPSPPKKPLDPDAKAEAIAQLQALQAKMRKRLEEDRAREAASGKGGPPPDPDLDDEDIET